MKLRPQIHRKTSGFTLIEMIGVLAVIAILASMLVPRVFQAIADSKVSNTAATCNSVKAAVGEYYGKYGKLAGQDGAEIGTNWVDNAIEDWDLKVLVPGNFVDKPFAVRIGNGKSGLADSGSRLRLLNISANLISDASTVDGAYDLDGSGTVNDTMGARLVEAVIPDVEAQDAKDLNDRIDGKTLSIGTNTVVLTSPDTMGRVKYGTPSSDGLTTVFVYIAHR